MEPLDVVSRRYAAPRGWLALTINQDSIGERVHRPDVGCPICVAQTAGKRKQAREDLWDLVDTMKSERSESKHDDERDSTTEFQTVEELYVD